MSLFHEASVKPIASANSIASSSGVLLLNVTCDASVYVNACVRMDALGVAYNALADSEANSNMIGVAVEKPTATTCHIRVNGVTPAIYAGLDPTLEYYLSDTVAGEITTTIPVLSGHVVLRVGQPFSATRLFVNKGNRFVRA